MVDRNVGDCRIFGAVSVGPTRLSTRFTWETCQSTNKRTGWDFVGMVLFMGFVDCSMIRTAFFVSLNAKRSR